jgi:hypothetical protein
MLFVNVCWQSYCHFVYDYRAEQIELIKHFMCEISSSYGQRVKDRPFGTWHLGYKKEHATCLCNKPYVTSSGGVAAVIGRRHTVVADGKSSVLVIFPSRN